MIDINKVILVGRIGANPIQRQTKSGKAVVHFSVATSRRIYREDTPTQSGTEPVQETQWHKVVSWGKQGEACAQYLKKGSAVYVEGHIRSRQYESKEGVEKTSFEVHTDHVSFLGDRPGVELESPESITSAL